MAPISLLLVNPNPMKPPVAPLALDYLSAALAQEGISHDLLDLTWEEDAPGALQRRLSGKQYSAVGLTIRNTCDSYFASQDFQLPRIKQIIGFIRQHSQAPIILGGVGYSLSPLEILEYCQADFGLKGEGEGSLPRLLKALPEPENFPLIPGLVWRYKGELKANPASFLHLQDLTLCRRDFIDNHRYFQEGGQAGFESKRGCNQRCIYCADPVSKGRGVRLRPPADVAQELANLYALGIDHFHTCDSEFNLPPEHALAVCSAIIEKGLGDKIRWYAYCAPYPFTGRLAAAMKRAGCVGINFGADSGDNAMLTRLGRTHRATDLRQLMNICRHHELVVMFDLLLGGPGEDRQSLARTVSLMKELEPHRVGISYGLRVYRGTQLAREIQRDGFGENNFALHSSLKDNFEFLAPVYYLSPDLGEGGYDYLRDLVGKDPRFFLGDKAVEENYNYNDNSTLCQALKQGHKGAYWDILRRIQDEAAKSQ